MKRKFFIGLAPLLAIAAFAVMPVAAQALPHYTSNANTIPEGEKVITTAWGTLTLASETTPGQKVVCHSADAGIIENVGGVGKGTTELFGAYDCEQEKFCPTPVVEISAEALPWSLELTEKKVGTIRQESKGVKVFIECMLVKHEKPPVGGAKFVIREKDQKEKLGQRPIVEHGTSALHPGYLEFSEAGSLEIEGSKEASHGSTEGQVKVLGYNEQELINVGK